MIAVARKAVAGVNAVIKSMYFNRHNYDRFVSVADTCPTFLYSPSILFPQQGWEKFDLYYLKIGIKFDAQVRSFFRKFE